MDETFEIVYFGKSKGVEEKIERVKDKLLRFMKEEELESLSILLELVMETAYHIAVFRDGEVCLIKPDEKLEKAPCIRIKPTFNLRGEVDGAFALFDCQIKQIRLQNVKNYFECYSQYS